MLSLKGELDKLLSRSQEGMIDRRDGEQVRLREEGGTGGGVHLTYL